MKKIIFSTCYIPDENIKDNNWTYQHTKKNSQVSTNRILQWFDYYKMLFPDYNLISFHDGVIPNGYRNQLSDLNIIELENHLGRVSGHCFPGWRRSFREALKYSKEYDIIVHIESDIYIKKKYINKYSELFKTLNVHYNGPFVGGMMTTALQLLNNKENNKKIIDFYSKDENLYSDIITERQFRDLVKSESKFYGYYLKNSNDLLNIVNIIKDDKNEYIGQLTDLKYINLCLEN